MVVPCGMPTISPGVYGPSKAVCSVTQSRAPSPGYVYVTSFAGAGRSREASVVAQP